MHGEMLSLLTEDLPCNRDSLQAKAEYLAQPGLITMLGIQMPGLGQSAELCLSPQQAQQAEAAT